MSRPTAKTPGVFRFGASTSAADRYGQWLALVYALALLLVAAAWPPDRPPALRQGGGVTILSGALTAAQAEVAVLAQARAGVPVTITLISPDFDPVLSVYDAAGERIAFNDDNDTEMLLPRPLDSAVIFTPERDEVLTVLVASFAPGERGDYTLTLEGLDVIQQAQGGVVSNASGNVVEGVLNPLLTRVAYTFQAAADTLITITASSQDFDTLLEVYDEAGERVAANDDHADPTISLPGPLDSAVRFAVPRDGVYTVVVRSFDQAGGRFTVTIAGAAFGPYEGGGFAVQVSAPCDHVISAVVVVSSVFGGGFEPERLIDLDPSTGWSSRGDDEAPYIIFEVGGGGPLTLDGVVFNGYSSSPDFVNDSVRRFEVAVSAERTTDPAAFTPVLSAEAPLENDLLTYPFEPVSARYVLLRPLTNYGGGYFQATEFNACTTLGDEGLRGEPPYTVSGLLQIGQPYAEYRLYAIEGVAMTATLVSEAFDPVLEVYDARGARLADNDSHPPDFDLPRAQDAALRLTVREAGLIVVRVRSFAGGGGAFQLMIDGSGLSTTPPPEGELPPCLDLSSTAVGGSIAGFSSEFGGRWRAEYLLDGDEETGWASGPGEEHARTEYVIVDLAGDLQMVGGVRINPAATGGDSDANNVSRFAVLVSDKDLAPESFREVFATTLEERYTHRLAFEFAPVRARYVMLQTRDNFGGRWHEVAEFVVCAAE